MAERADGSLSSVRPESCLFITVYGGLIDSNNMHWYGAKKVKKAIKGSTE